MTPTITPEALEDLKQGLREAGVRQRAGAHSYLFAEALRALNELQTAPAAAGVPEGYVLVPKQFGIPAETWDAAAFAFGGPSTGEDEPFLDCTAWIGEIVGDEGQKTYGLHINCDECPDEGSITLAEFPAYPNQPAAQSQAAGTDEVNPNIGTIRRAMDALGANHELYPLLDHAAAELAVLTVRDQRRAQPQAEQQGAGQ